MKHCKLLLFFLPLLIIFSTGQSDTRISRPVGPGMVHTEIFLDEGPLAIDILEIDLTNPFVVLETVKAQDRLEGYERTSAMAARRSWNGHFAVGAINGDFYATGGVPIGAQIRGGELLKEPITRSMFCYTLFGGPIIDVFNYSGAVIAADGQDNPIHGINHSRGTGELILFNHFFGPNTGTNQWGAEVTFVPLGGEFVVSDTLTGTVIALQSGTGNAAIPNTGVILSGHGSSQDFINNHIALGDTIRMVLNLSAIWDPFDEPLVEGVGGTPRIVRGGAVSVEYAEEGISYPFCTARHPRTAVGFSQDSTIVYFFTVDGRQQGYSIGINLFQLAELMIEEGVYEGMNLDGGGSTTMVVRGQVVNSPSDATGERYVANALLAVSTAPLDTLAYLNVMPDSLEILAGLGFQFGVEGWDEYYNPIPDVSDSVSWACDLAIGTVGPDGFFTADTMDAEGFLWAHHNGIADSARVRVIALDRLELYPAVLFLDIGQSFQVGVRVYDSGNNLVSVPLGDIDWALLGDVGEISSTGTFTATQEGEGFIVASYSILSDTLRVNVGGEGSFFMEIFDDLSGWSLSGLGGILIGNSFDPCDTLFITGPSSGRLTYRFDTGGSSVLYLNCNLPIPGYPDSLGFHLYGDGWGHWVQGIIRDADNELFFLDFITGAGVEWTGEWRRLNKSVFEAIPDFSNPGASLDFPLLFQGFKLNLGAEPGVPIGEGILFFDDLEVEYLQLGVEPGVQGEMIPASFYLSPAYPNPFNDSTTLYFIISKPERVTVDLYNIRGQRVATLMDGYVEEGRHRVVWETEPDTPSGLYLCRMGVEELFQVRKLLLLK